MLRLRVVLMCALVAGCAKGQPGGSDPDAPDHGGPDAPINPHNDGPSGPDAMLPPDAAMHPDAQPDAAGCTVQQVQLLLNRSFDAAPIGVNWTQQPFDPGYPLITVPPTGVNAVSAPNIVWMGGFLNGSDRLYQDVAIPAGTTALVLKGRRFFATAELPGFPYDLINIDLKTTGNVQLASLAAWSNNDSTANFVAFSLPSPDPYAGQTIRVNYHDTCDDTNNTNFFLDSMQLLATVCQ